MADCVILHLIGGEQPVRVDLGGRSSLDEWRDFEAATGRWAAKWVPIESEGNRTTFVRRGAVIKVELEYSGPPPNPVE